MGVWRCGGGSVDYRSVEVGVWRWKCGGGSVEVGV